MANGIFDISFLTVIRRSAGHTPCGSIMVPRPGVGASSFPLPAMVGRWEARCARISDGKQKLLYASISTGGRTNDRTGVPSRDRIWLPLLELLTLTSWAYDWTAWWIVRRFGRARVRIDWHKGISALKSTRCCSLLVRIFRFVSVACPVGSQVYRSKSSTSPLADMADMAI